MQHIDSLLNQMEADRLPCHRDIVADGRIHRYSCKDTPVLDEWYVAHPMSNGHLLCVYGSWRSSHQDKRVYKSWDGEDPTLEREHTIYMKSIDEEIAREIKEGTETAIEYFKSSPLCVEHPYLSRKKIHPHFTRVYEGWLLIPVYDGDGKIISVQKIANDGTKRFAKRTSCKFGRFIFGDLEKARRVLVCEGFATGASIYEATQDCVVVAFSCGNLHKVGFDLVQRYKSKSVALCADLGVSGVDSSIKWKELVSQTVYFPDMKGKEGKDFNDMSVEPSLGKEAIKAILCPKLTPKGVNALMTQGKDVEWIVPQLIVRGSVNMIHAVAGGGKSAIAMELSYAVSTGKKFWFYETVKGNVLYLDGELSAAENKSRWGSIIDRKGNETPEDDNLMIVSPDVVFEQFEEAIDLYSKEWQARIDPLIEKSDLIVLDNLSTLTGIGGDADFENRASSWIVIGNWLRKWKAKGKSFLIIHHSSKAGTPRGTSRLMVDTMLQWRLEPVYGNPNADINIRIHFEKAREIRATWKQPFFATLENNHWRISKG